MIYFTDGEEHNIEAELLDRSPLSCFWLTTIPAPAVVEVTNYYSSE
jgi:hypothetical protein